MNRKLTLPLVLLLILVWVAPAGAAVQLNANGRTYDVASNLNIQEGITSAPLNVLSHILGCTVTLDGNNITMQENQNCLKMTVGSTAAVLNDQEKKMPQAPQFIGGQVYVPIRFVCDSFGASVAWNEAEQSVSISYTETRDGMTAEDFMAKASQQLVDANRYKMTLDMDMIMDMTVQETGKNPEVMKMQMDSKSDCWVQTNPMLMYMKQNSTVNLPEINVGGIQNVQTEMVFNDSGMYMTMPQFGWVKMNLPGVNLQELMKQSNTQDPTAALQQMKDLGMSISLANDQERNGQKYWVVDVAMGSDIYKSDYFKQIYKTLSIPETGDLQKIIDGMDLDLSYSIFINQKTFYTDFMDLQGKIKMGMDSPDITKPAHIAMNMDIKCSYTMSDFGVVFPVPDVSKAVDFDTVIKQAK